MQDYIIVFYAFGIVIGSITLFFLICRLITAIIVNILTGKNKLVLNAKNNIVNKIKEKDDSKKDDDPIKNM